MLTNPINDNYDSLLYRLKLKFNNIYLFNYQFISLQIEKGRKRIDLIINLKVVISINISFEKRYAQFRTLLLQKFLFLNNTPTGTPIPKQNNTPTGTPLFLINTPTGTPIPEQYS